VTRAELPRQHVIILGIDPGTAATGFGVVARRSGGAVSLVECGVIRTSTKAPLPKRIREIYEGVAGLIERHQPFAMSVEDVFHGKNAQSALKLGHARVVMGQGAVVGGEARLGALGPLDPGLVLDAQLLEQLWPLTLEAGDIAGDDRQQGGFQNRAQERKPDGDQGKNDKQKHRRFHSVISYHSSI
jgi:hypothetical protein